MAKFSRFQNFFLTISDIVDIYYIVAIPLWHRAVGTQFSFVRRGKCREHRRFHTVIIFVALRDSLQ